MATVVIAAAMEKELSPFIEMTGIAIDTPVPLYGHTAAVCITGVGPVAATYNIHKAINRHSPDMVIQAGVGGCYPGSGLKVGDVVIVEKERLADLGVITDSGFDAPFGKDLLLENKGRYGGGCRCLPRVSANTVSTACSPYTPQDAQVESMEGYSVFYVCLKSEVKFIELRAISNIVSTDRGSWDLPLAANNLARSLNEILNSLIL